jgi:hemerythrin superfamily protein
MEWILFTIGLLLGLLGGVVGVSLTSMSKISDLDSEIISLRTQRNLLKDELLKKKRPYKKKKYYNKHKK